MKVFLKTIFLTVLFQVNLAFAQSSHPKDAPHFNPDEILLEIEAKEIEIKLLNPWDYCLLLAEVAIIETGKISNPPVCSDLLGFVQYLDPIQGPL